MIDPSLPLMTQAAQRGLARMQLKRMQEETKPFRSILDDADRPMRQKIRDGVRKELIPRLRSICDVIVDAHYLTQDQKNHLLLEMQAADAIPPEFVD
jgi:hypothetical protein